MIPHHRDRRSAIVCSHVLEDGLPILRAKRDELDEEDPSDSGWQFLCHSGVLEGMRTIRVVSIEEILHLEPSLEPFLDREVGSVVIRSKLGERWVDER